MQLLSSQHLPVNLHQVEGHQYVDIRASILQQLSVNDLFGVAVLQYREIIKKETKNLYNCKVRVIQDTACVTNIYIHGVPLNGVIT